MSFTDSFSSVEASIHLISDMDETGRQAYYFIKVARQKLSSFLAAAKSRTPINLADYGEVVYSAYGDYPPPHIQSWARTELGWRA